MKRLFFLLLLALVATYAQAQVKQARSVGSFQALQTGGGIDVFLTQGSTTSVVVEADKEVLSHLKTEVKGNTLEISWDQAFSLMDLLRNRRSANVYVTCPRLESLSVSGGSDVRGRSPFKADNFKIDASGGSDVILTLNAKTLSGSASGGSDLRLDGRVQRQTVSVSGGSDYHGFNLQSTSAEVSASGGADANISVDGDLTASASGGSDLRYKGKARVVKSSASGGGSIHRAD